MTDQKASASDYLAAERTFLAWIRTGLALMGLGFVVARFGLFLQTLAIAASDPAYRAYGPSFWFGTGFIILGVVCHRRKLVELLSPHPGTAARRSWL